MMQLPTIALSIRQPWAWAIVAGAGGKDVENRSRSTFAVTKADFKQRPVAIHAAQGMTRHEYEDAADFMARLGVQCPHPAALVRGAIIGAATVTAVVEDHPSPWFVGPRGLLLADQRQVEPVPAVGALGFFKWRRHGALAEPRPWMAAWPGERLSKTVQRRAGQPAGTPLLDLAKPDEHS